MVRKIVLDEIDLNGVRYIDDDVVCVPMFSGSQLVVSDGDTIGLLIRADMADDVESGLFTWRELAKRVDVSSVLNTIFAYAPEDVEIDPADVIERLCWIMT